MWRATHDIRLTPHGRAKAMQHGATAQDLAASIDSCTLCGACEPACPEEIDLVGMVLRLRGELGRGAALAEPVRPAPARSPVQRSAAMQIVPDRALAANAGLLAQVAQLFGGAGHVSLVLDDGRDIARAIEAGQPVSPARVANFLAPLRLAQHLIVGDALLLRALRDWLPGKKLESIGVALSSLEAVRGRLRASDLYVIESRAYHADRERLVKYYDGLRLSHGCAMNLDLQRLAIPTTAGSLPDLLGKNLVDPLDQARWILEGREFSRVVVEDWADVAVFRAVTDKPVMHLAQLTNAPMRTVA